ncbi:MAG: hypothetical protein RLZZ262_770, partial [Bacteroidota bacterium]
MNVKKTILVKLFFIVFLCLGMINAQAQDSLWVHLDGLVFDEQDQPISNIIVVNQRTKNGSFGKSNGTFSIRCLKSDTISVTSLGFYSRNIVLADSAVASSYKVKIYLDVRVYKVPTVEIIAPKDLEQIQKDIASLGYDEDDYQLSGLNAAASPITFLYQQFSQKEQSIRKVAEMENADRKRELLKSLFYHYVDYGIIELNNTEFDDFIDYLNV